MMDFETLLKKLAQPAQRALQNAGIHSLEQLVQYREKEILALHGMGKKGMEIILAALREHNLSFKA
jgi:DNA-directed RNA polymerase alpha subunit